MTDLPANPVASKEERIQLAIDAFRTGRIPFVKTAADTYDVPRSTLQNRLRGVQPLRVAKQDEQRLSVQEEEAIVAVAFQLHAWGWPLTIRALEELAASLLAKKDDHKPLGKNWYSRFLTRHHELRMIWSKSMDQARKDATDLATLEEWFELYQSTKQQYGIPDEDTYNVDEKGCMKGIGDNCKVLVPRSEATATTAQPGNRDWVSIIECISATAFVLPPFIIFEGQRIGASWINDKVDKDIVIHVSPNGWTDREIAVVWIKHFDRYTSPRTLGDYRLLIFDGHNSHCSLEFVNYCQDNKIIPLCLPPHSTHELQPLDVGVFGPLAKIYRQLVSKHSIFGAQRIDNLQFLLIYQEARRKTIQKNSLGGWRGAGLVPFNPNKVLDRHRHPKTPPFATFTNRYGQSVKVEFKDQESGDQIDTIVENLLQVCPTPLKKGVVLLKKSYLTVQADCSALQILNESLVEKATQGRRKAARKHHGEARVLTVEAILEKNMERKVKEAEAAKAKARREALRGKSTFVRLIWKEMPVKYDVFE